MRNIKLIMEYDGTHFFGWQIQPEQRTVQGELQTALEQFLGKATKITGAGRTDTGVHALGQVANFNIEKSYDAETIQNALNARLPDDIHIKSAEEVAPSFHARFDASTRIYIYRIATSFSVFESRYAWFCEYQLNIARMNNACTLLIGEVDCTSFAIAKSKKENMSMRIKNCEFTEHRTGIRFEIEADRFLHKSVRTIVGTLLLIGKGKMDRNKFKTIIEARDRERAGETAPALGLYLTEVKYAKQEHNP